MKLSLKRLFARSMTGGLDLVEPPVSPSSSPRSAKRKMMFVTLAGVLAIVGTLAGAYYFAMRPVALRIAVGPANSHDLHLGHTLTPAFAHTHSHIPFRPPHTPAPPPTSPVL